MSVSTLSYLIDTALFRSTVRIHNFSNPPRKNSTKHFTRLTKLLQLFQRFYTPYLICELRLLFSTCKLIMSPPIT